MTRFFVTIWLSILVSSALAQMPIKEASYVAELTQRAELKSNGDSIRADAMLNLCSYWSATDQKKAKQYLLRARALGKKYPFIMANARYTEAGSCSATETVRSRKLYLEADKALSSFTSPTAFLLRSKLWLNYAASYQIENSTYAANLILNKAIPMAKKTDKPAMVYYMYADLAVLLSNDSEIKKAIQYYLIAIDGIRKTGSKSARLPTAYVGAAAAYLQIDSLNRVSVMLKEANGLLSVNPESPAYPDYYTVEAGYYLKTKQFQRALSSALKGEQLARKLSLDYLVPALAGSRFQAYVGLKDHANAQRTGLMLTRDSMFNELPHEKRVVYDELAKLFASKKDYQQAYTWLEKYAVLTDSLNTLKTQSEINALEIKYQTAQNRARISTLKLKTQQATKNASRGRKMSILLFLTCAMLAGLIVLLAQNQRNLKKLALSQRLNAENKLHELKQEKQLELSAALIDGEERERQRLGADLHDGLGGLLAGTKLQLLSMPASSTEEIKIMQEKVSAMIDQSLTELRMIARNMMPENLLSFGLTKSLHDLCAQLSSTTIKIDCQIYDVDPQIHISKQIMIFRIIQELIANSLKHSGAGWILVQLSQSLHTMIITVEDNGKGLSPSLATQKNGLGMGNIKSRVQYLNGKLEIISHPDEGTSVHIEVNV